MIEYLQNDTVISMFDAAPVLRKKSETLLRKPLPEEVGMEFPTFVKDGNSVRLESQNIITEDCVIARNPGIIGVVEGFEVQNEWPILDRSIAIKNYGQEVIDNLNVWFTSHKKIATLKAIKLDTNIMKILGVEGKKLEINVDWSDRPMTAKIGDFLTNQGYSISKKDMNAYEQVS